jgi:hypothetical protein
MSPKNEHAFFGHARDTNLDVVGVLPVIFSRKAPAGKVVS